MTRKEEHVHQSGHSIIVYIRTLTLYTEVIIALHLIEYRFSTASKWNSICTFKNWIYLFSIRAFTFVEWSLEYESNIITLKTVVLTGIACFGAWNQYSSHASYAAFSLSTFSFENVVELIHDLDYSTTLGLLAVVVGARKDIKKKYGI